VTILVKKNARRKTIKNEIFLELPTGTYLLPCFFAFSLVLPLGAIFPLGKDLNVAV